MSRVIDMRTRKAVRDARLFAQTGRTVAALGLIGSVIEVVLCTETLTPIDRGLLEHAVSLAQVLQKELGG